MKRNCVGALLLVVLLVAPILQIVSAAINSSPAYHINTKSFSSREELRTARNLKWLEWWVTILLRQLGIEPK